MTITTDIPLTILKRYKYADILAVDSRPNIVIVSATSEYIPRIDFERIFTELSQTIIERRIKKVIFDKSSLTVFHQPSMEWYFTVWKEMMYHHGLMTHRKILPNDKVFKESARIARQKLVRDFPSGKYRLMDIKYAENLTQAIEE